MPIVNIFYDSLSFSTATDVWDDAALTTPSADGWYSELGIYREKVSGVLGPVQICPSCNVLVPCGSSITASGNEGQYALNFSVGIDIGAIVVKFYPANVPDKCAWTFDGVTASEYSCKDFGYLEGIIGNVAQGLTCNSSTQPLTNATGSNGQSYSGTLWEYNGTTFINTTSPVTMGPYLPSDVTLTATDPGWAYMVIPKPNVGPETVSLLIDAMCGTTGWFLEIYCPRALDLRSVGSMGGTCGIYATPMYSCSVLDVASPLPGANGSSADLGLHDWVFEDPNGVTPFGAGQYPTLIAGVDSCITVSSDGIITAITTCSGSCT